MDYKDQQVKEKGVMIMALQYKAPITCHFFIKNKKLILLTYYGLFPAYEGFNPKDFIDFLIR